MSSDGSCCKRNGVVIISTDSMTPSEVNQIRSILLVKYDIHSTRIANGKGKDQYRYRIPTVGVPKLQALVAPHIPPLMRSRAEALTLSFLVLSLLRSIFGYVKSPRRLA